MCVQCVSQGLSRCVLESTSPVYLPIPGANSTEFFQQLLAQPDLNNQMNREADDVILSHINYHLQSQTP